MGSDRSMLKLKSMRFAEVLAAPKYGGDKTPACKIPRLHGLNVCDSSTTAEIRSLACANRLENVLSRQSELVEPHMRKKLVGLLAGDILRALAPESRGKPGAKEEAQRRAAECVATALP